jgi:glycerol-3-phosphate acyltransferase PlsY
LLIVVSTRYVSIGSMIAVGSYPLLIYLCGALAWTAAPPPWLYFTALLLSLLIVGKHYENVLSLRDGKEWKLGDPSD